MAKRSIVEEALLEAKQLEEALKKNSKEILAATMRQDIDKMVKASLNEDEMADNDGELDEESQMEGSENESTMVMDEEDELISSEEDSDEISSETDDVESPEYGEEDVDTFSDDVESPEYGEEDMETEVSFDEPEADDDSEVLDMTNASPDKVISVFKLMDDDDEIEVIKTDNGVEIKDNKTGAGYMVKMNESMDGHDEDEMMSYDDEDEMMSYDDEDESMSYDDEDESMSYGDEDENKAMRDLKKMFSITAKDESSCDECGWQENDEPIYEITFDDEDESMDHKSMKSSDEGSRRTLHDRRAKQIHPQNYPLDESVKKEYNQVIREYRELKDKYLQTKDALKVFRDKLSEIALFNSNLTHAVKLFMEHATTKQEKTVIMQRFDDEAVTLKESKRLYKTISNELKDRKPISEKVEKKINESLTKGSSDTLIESKVYIDPQISKIHSLMDKLDSRK